MKKRIEELLASNLQALGQRGPLPEGRMRWAVINGGITIRSKLVCPCWTSGGEEPDFILKFARYPQYNSRLRSEQQALTELQKYLKPGAEMAPRPLLASEVDGLLVTVESGIPGRPLRAYLREHGRQYKQTLSRLRPFAVWMSDMHARCTAVAGPLELEELVFAPLEAAVAELGLAHEERQALSWLHALALELAQRHRLPIVFNQNDSDTTNVMTDRGGRFTGLIDWEFGEYGLPSTDLFYFLARFAYETRAAGTDDQLRGYRELYFYPARLDEEALEPDVAARWLNYYCRRVRLEPAWLPVMFGLTWVMHARNERARLIELKAEGQVMHGKPATVTVATADEATFQRGHFRSQLRHYLLNMDTSVVALISQRGMPT